MTGKSESKKKLIDARPGLPYIGRRGGGQSIIEVLVGGIILIPIVLAILDMGVVVLGGEICNDLAKQAARAAANASNFTDANTAVASVQTNFPGSFMYSGLLLTSNASAATFVYGGSVTVNSSVTITLPVPVPLLNVGSTMAVSSQATESILGIAPPAPGLN
jgi:hypothetical protein